MQEALHICTTKKNYRKIRSSDISRDSGLKLRDKVNDLSIFRQF